MTKKNRNPNKIQSGRAKRAAPTRKAKMAEAAIAWSKKQTHTSYSNRVHPDQLLYLGSGGQGAAEYRGRGQELRWRGLCFERVRGRPLGFPGQLARWREPVLRERQGCLRRWEPRVLSFFPTISLQSFHRLDSPNSITIQLPFVMIDVASMSLADAETVSCSFVCCVFVPSSMTD
jgi:hypothetical protein